MTQTEIQYDKFIAFCNGRDLLTDLDKCWFFGLSLEHMTYIHNTKKLPDSTIRIIELKHIIENMGQELYKATKKTYEYELSR